jgi:hypothetical protein
MPPCVYCIFCFVLCPEAREWVASGVWHNLTDIVHTRRHVTRETVLSRVTRYQTVDRLARDVPFPWRCCQVHHFCDYHVILTLHVMSKLLPNGRIKLPTPYKLLQLPGIEFPKRLEGIISPSPSAVDGHSATNEYGQPGDLLALDHGDFLMGEIDISLRGAHIINACLRDHTQPNKIVSLSLYTCVG